MRRRSLNAGEAANVADMRCRTRPVSAIANFPGVFNLGAPTVKHTAFPTPEIESSASVVSPSSSRKRLHFHWLLDALHRSRGIQAQHLLRQHRHLIGDTRPSASNQIRGKRTSIIQRFSIVSRNVAPSQNLLLAMIAVAFLVLHVVAGFILQNVLAADPGAASDKASFSSYD
jgi:hypothetical protein